MRAPPRNFSSTLILCASSSPVTRPNGSPPRRRCGWRIKPSVIPTGYKLRLAFDYVNTERGYDIVQLFDGDGGDALVGTRTHELAGSRVPPHLAAAGVSTLVEASGNEVPEARLSDAGGALLRWSTDDSKTRAGGFVFRYELQALQPPDRPSAVAIPPSLITTMGAQVSWTAPASTVPILWYRLMWEHSATAGAGEMEEQVLPSTTTSAPLAGLVAGTSYDVTLQAWTASVDPSACSGGETSACSQLSPLANFTTSITAKQVHISVRGSYLYGNGTRSNPFAMDVQGVIDREEVTNGAEIILHPGVYSQAVMTGPGSTVDLNLRGKLLTIRALEGAGSVVFDCAASARFLTFNHSEPPSVRLIGLTIRRCGGAPDGRGALWVTGGARPSVENCTFESNVAERGGAFVADAGAEPTFIGCTFVDNNATSGCPCSLAKRSDATCDAECATRACGFDYAGGCCPPTCEQGWADGFCVAACNVAACGFDGGDCCPTASCVNTRADGVCDAACNVQSCGFDGGDCEVDAGLSWGGYELAEQVGSADGAQHSLQPSPAQCLWALA